MQPISATILVVDDDTAIREAIVYELKRKNFKTLEAANGAQAYMILKMFKVNLVISDIKMPGGDGIELLKNIGILKFSKPAFVFVSGCNMQPLEAITLGAQKIFHKPFSRNELMLEVSRLIGVTRQTTD